MDSRIRFLAHLFYRVPDAICCQLGKKLFKQAHNRQGCFLLHNRVIAKGLVTMFHSRHIFQELYQNSDTFIALFHFFILNRHRLKYAVERNRVINRSVNLLALAKHQLTIFPNPTGGIMRQSIGF